MNFANRFFASKLVAQVDANQVEIDRVKQELKKGQTASAEKAELRVNPLNRSDQRAQATQRRNPGVDLVELHFDQRAQSVFGSAEFIQQIKSSSAIGTAEARRN